MSDAATATPAPPATQAANGAQQVPTHFAIPIELFKQVVKVIGSQPWEDVHPLMEGLMSCPTFSMNTQGPPKA